MMAFVRRLNLVDATTNHFVSYVSEASLCWRTVMNWLMYLYTCYVHHWLLQLMNAELFTCSNGDTQAPLINKPSAARCPLPCLPSEDPSHGVGFHTNSSPQTCPLGIEEEDLRRIFEGLDGDGDGMVSGDDLQRHLQNLGLHNNNNMTSHDDDEEDEQCFIDFDDFCSLCLPLFAHSEENQSEGVLMEAFFVFDKNGNGFITPHDLQRLLPSLGFNEGHDVELCKNMILKFDTNCDGRIDFVEFENMMVNRTV